MSKLKMLRADIDYDSLDLEDPDVVRALSVAASEIKYNSRLYEFLDTAYPWQQEAIARTLDHRVVGLIASNQTGKSETAMSLVACLATGVIPDWWKGRKYDRPVKIMVAGVDSNHNKNVLQEKLFGSNNWRLKAERGSGMIPRDYIIDEAAVTVRGDDLSSIKIRHVTGGMSEILFRAYSQGREAAQGVQADFIVIDEQPKDDFWSEALLRTAATDGCVVCSFTPLKGMTGLVAELMELPPEKESPKDKYGFKFKSENGWSMVRATWDDISHISEENKDQLRKGIPDYEVATRTYGMPMAGHGRVFPFTRDEITFNDKDLYIEDKWPRLTGIDIGHGFGRDPSAAVLAIWDEEKDIIYIDRVRKESTDTTKDMARLIVTVEHQCPVAFPSDANRSSMSSDTTVAQQLREMDIQLLTHPFMNPKGADGKKNNYKMPGIKHISERMREGKLKIHPNRCAALLDELDQYSYTDTGKLQDGNDHCIDAFRYAVMSIIQGLGQPLKQDPFVSDSEDGDWNFY